MLKMNITDYPNTFKHIDYNIGVLGDIHGEFNVIFDKIKTYNLSNTVLFQVGDFGVGFNYNDPREPIKEKKRLSILNKTLVKKDIYLYVVRGNHDNPIFFDGTHNFSNIIFMKDYDTIVVNNHIFLAIGGATSIDRKPCHLINHNGRREGISWWSDEKIIFDKSKLNIKVDVVLSHTCPNIAHPIGLDSNMNTWFKTDPTLEDELNIERQTLKNIYDLLKVNNNIKYWFYGHYHHSHFMKIDETIFRLLDINELTEIKIY